MQLGLFSLPVSNFLIFIGIKLSFLIFQHEYYLWMAPILITYVGRKRVLIPIFLITGGGTSQR